MKIAVDTNILLDLLDERRSGYSGALLLVEACQKSNIELVAFADSILTIKYVLRRENNIETIEALRVLCDTINIIDTKSEAVLKALEICNRYDFDEVEDIAKIINSQDEGCEIFVTNDKSMTELDFDEINIAVVDTDEVLSRFGYQKNLLGEYVLEKNENMIDTEEDIEKLVSLLKKLEQKGINIKKIEDINKVIEKLEKK